MASRLSKAGKTRERGRVASTRYHGAGIAWWLAHLHSHHHGDPGQEGQGICPQPAAREQTAMQARVGHGSLVAAGGR